MLLAIKTCKGSFRKVCNKMCGHSVLIISTNKQYWRVVLDYYLYSCNCLQASANLKKRPVISYFFSEVSDQVNVTLSVCV